MVRKDAHLTAVRKQEMKKPGPKCALPEYISSDLLLLTRPHILVTTLSLMLSMSALMLINP
jgi:hypothetical protein